MIFDAEDVSTNEECCTIFQFPIFPVVKQQVFHQALKAEWLVVLVGRISCGREMHTILFMMHLPGPWHDLVLSTV